MAWENARPQNGEKDDTIVTSRTEQIETKKYCRIVVSMGDTNLCIWSYLKARCRGYEFQFLARAFETEGFSVFLFRLLKRFHGIALVVQQVLPSQNTEKSFHPGVYMEISRI